MVRLWLYEDMARMGIRGVREAARHGCGVWPAKRGLADFVVFDTNRGAPPGCGVGGHPNAWRAKGHGRPDVICGLGKKAKETLGPTELWGAWMLRVCGRHCWPIDLTEYHCSTVPSSGQQHDHYREIRAKATPVIRPKVRNITNPITTFIVLAHPASGGGGPTDLSRPRSCGQLDLS